MTRDASDTVDGAIISHGPSSSRIYLMKLGQADTAKLIGTLKHLAETLGYTKIFAKVPESAAAPFLHAGYTAEASVPGLCRGKEPGLFLGYYLEESRRIPEDLHTIDHILDGCFEKHDAPPPKLSAHIFCRTCTTGDAEDLASLYQEVFPTYPFPIHDPAYIRETMEAHTQYTGIFSNSQLVAAASAEMDPDTLSAEMTDFATAPAWRGRGLARYLLHNLELNAADAGILTSYTIARAVSPGMNYTFAAAGYRYGGLLANNTQIAGSVESMNVWHKSLR